MGAAVTTLHLLVALAVANDSGTCAADGTCYSCLALSGGFDTGQLAKNHQ
jgi:ABC-type polysaccharide/polyol phosphate transport system ATPase subunit